MLIPVIDSCGGRFRTLVLGKASRGPVGGATAEGADVKDEKGIDEPSGPPGLGRGGIGIFGKLDGTVEVMRVPVGPVIIGVGVFERDSVVEGARR